MKFLCSLLFPLFFIFLINEKSTAQCVVINEVLINGPGSCDGSCNPDTEEWIELYNTCSSPIDIGCYVLTDGDFAVTIPQGTMLAGNGYYVIGSSGSIGNGTVNLNISTCNCASGTVSKIGTLTNPSDQLVLSDKNGIAQSGIIWGSGQGLPWSITATPASGTCPQTAVSVTSLSPFLEHLSSSGNNGCTVARACDGSSTWEERCSSTISMGTSNGVNSVVNFVASDSSICSGKCLSFTDKSTGNPTAWSWTFSNSDSASSSLKSPANICYNSNGNFDVTLQVTTACGNSSFTKPAYIKVGGSGQIPVVTALRDTICDGTPASLSLVDSTGLLQWQSSFSSSGFSNISSQTKKNLFTLPSQTTYYRAYVTTTGTCTDTSAAYKIIVNPSPVADYTFTYTGTYELTFNSSGSMGATHFEWVFDDNTTSTEANPIHSFPNGISQVYHICLNAYNGSNCSFTICKDVSVPQFIGMEKISNSNNWKVYPSPFSDYLLINSENSSEKIERVEVLDLLGRTFFFKDYGKAEQNSFQVDLSGLSSGIFLLKIKTDKSDYIQKVVKQ